MVKLAAQQSRIAAEEDGRLILPRAHLLHLARESVGSKMFTTLPTVCPGKDIEDLLCKGRYACYWYVGSILTLAGLYHVPRGTWVRHAEEDLSVSGWCRVQSDSPSPGDVIIWELYQSADDIREGRPGNEHIGLYVGDEQAISTARVNPDDPNTERLPCTHHYLFQDRSDGPRQLKSVWSHPSLAG